MGKREKTILWVFGIFLLIFSLKVSFWGGGGDFKVYLGAAELLKANESIYDVMIPTYGNNGLPYLYSPFFAFILIPLTFLPYKLIYVIWSLVNILLLYRIFKIIYSALKIQMFNDKYRFIFIAILIAFSTRFILYNFSMLQVTFLMLYCCLEGIYQAKNRPVLSGMLLALGISIKILPIVILPYLVIRNHLRVLIIAIAFTGIFLIIPATYSGFNKNNHLLKEWWTVVNPTKRDYNLNENLYGEGVHSLSAVIPTLLKPSESVYGITLKRNLTTLSDKEIKIVTYTIILTLIVLTLLFLRRPLFRKLDNEKNILYELGYILLIIPLIFPHQQKYAFIFMLPALGYIVDFVLQSYSEKTSKQITILTLLTISFILLVVSTDGIVGKHLYHLSQHFKLITYGTLLLVIALWLSRPKKTMVNL